MTRFGPWHAVRELGQGGSGVVYLCHHVETGEAAAVKTLRRVEHRDLGTLLREIEALGQLDVEGVVRVFDHGVTEGVPWLAMAWIDGVDLRSWLEAQWRADTAAELDPPVLRRFLGVLVRLCLVLDALHDRGIIHGDIKPGNILVDAAGQPIVVDFGLATERRLDGRASLARAAVWGGTLRYAAPEALAGLLVDARADLYAVGAIIYTLCTGVGPFAHVPRSQRAALKSSGTLAPMHEHMGGIPPELDALARRLMSPDPADRPGYADDVARALCRIGADAALPPLRSSRRPYLPRLHGRAAQVDQLNDALWSSDGAFLSMSGAPGVGKTRVALELAHGARAAGMRVVTATCVAEGVALATLIEQLTRPWRLQATPPEALKDGLGLLVELCPALRGAPACVGLAPVVTLPPEAGRHRLRHVLRTLLQDYAARRRTLVIVDDVHLAEGVLRDFLEWLSGPGGVPDGATVLTVASGTSADIQLGPLAAGPIRALTHDLLAATQLPSSFLAMVARHADGNPWFAVETVHSAMEEGILRYEGDGRWQIEEGRDLDLPRGIAELCSRRLEVLDEVERGALIAAAILGRTFDPDLLAAMGASGQVPALVVHGFLSEDGARLRFTHRAMHQAALEAATPATRARLHGAAAEALAARRDASPGQLARHWEGAGRAERAAPSYLAAGRLAERHHAHTLSEAAYRAAIRTAEVGSDTWHAAVFELSARVLSALGRFAEAAGLLDRALTENGQGDPGRRCRLLVSLAHAHRSLGQSDRALALYTRAVMEAEALGDASLRLKAHAGMGALRTRVGDNQGAAVSYAAAMAASKELGDPKAHGDLLSNRAVFLHRAGDLAGARRLYQQALDIARACDATRLEAIVQGNLAIVFLGLGEHDRAERCYREALTFARRSGDRVFEGRTLANIAGLLRERGDLAGARAAYLQALDIHRAMEAHRDEAIARQMLGTVALDEGRLDEASAELGAALEAHRSAGTQRFEAEALQELSRLHRLGRGDLARARELAEQAGRLYGATDDRQGLVMALCERAHVGVAEGRLDWELVERARRLAPDLLTPGSETRAYVDRAERALWALADGRPLLRGTIPDDVPPGLRGAIEAS